MITNTSTTKLKHEPNIHSDFITVFFKDNRYLKSCTLQQKKLESLPTVDH